MNVHLAPVFFCSHGCTQIFSDFVEQIFIDEGMASIKPNDRKIVEAMVRLKILIHSIG